MQRWEALIQDINRSGAVCDVNKLIQIVLQEAKEEMNGDLQYLTMRVKYLEDLKKEIRKYIGELRGYLAQFQGQPLSVIVKDYSPSISFAMLLRNQAVSIPRLFSRLNKNARS